MKKFFNWKVLLIAAVVASLGFSALNKIAVDQIRFTTSPSYGTPPDSSILYKGADGIVRRTNISSESSAGYLVLAEVTLTDAEIKALPTTPIELVAAAGAGKIIKIIDITAVQKIVSGGSYTNVNTGSYLTLINDNNVFGLSASPLEEGSGDWFSPGVTNYQGYYETTMENMPVMLAVNNSGGGNFTGGNAANTLKINVYYVVVDL